MTSVEKIQSRYRTDYINYKARKCGRSGWYVWRCVGKWRGILFLYDSKKQKGIVYEQPLLKMLSAIERIQEKNQLTLETVSKICKDTIQ